MRAIDRVISMCGRYVAQAKSVDAKSAYAHVETFAACMKELEKKTIVEELKEVINEKLSELPQDAFEDKMHAQRALNLLIEIESIFSLMKN